MSALLFTFPLDNFRHRDRRHVRDHAVPEQPERPAEVDAAPPRADRPGHAPRRRRHLHHIAHRRLQLHRRDVVTCYIKYLTANYKENNFWAKTLEIVKKIVQLLIGPQKNNLLSRKNLTEQDKSRENVQQF